VHNYAPRLKICGSERIAICFLNPDTRWREVVRITQRPFYRWGKSPGSLTTGQEAGWAPELVWRRWRGEKSLVPTGNGFYVSFPLLRFWRCKQVPPKRLVPTSITTVACWNVQKILKCIQTAMDISTFTLICLIALYEFHPHSDYRNKTIMTVGMN
jgi:hypothetical protein